MASRYASFDSRSSATSSSSPCSSSSKAPPSNSKLSTFKRLITHGRVPPGTPPASTAAPPPRSPFPNRALVRAASRPGDIVPAAAGAPKKKGDNLGTMVRNFIDKKKSLRKCPPSPARGLIAIPRDPIAEEAKKAAAAKGNGSNLSSALHRKLFQKGTPGVGSQPKALTEVKSNTRTLAMVLRSERELLNQNKEYEAEVLELKMVLEEEKRVVEKLKNLCIKQKEEIKALKDAILFPDVMNAHLQNLLERQGSELKEAKHVIPTLQKQVSSLTGQLQCLAEGLAEVKAEKYAGRSCSDGTFTSPTTPTNAREYANSLDFTSIDPSSSDGQDDMFLQDLNPCLTPCFSKTKSKEFNVVNFDSP